MNNKIKEIHEWAVLELSKIEKNIIGLEYSTYQYSRILLKELISKIDKEI